jgi:predicted nucleic acid-binding protein
MILDTNLIRFTKEPHQQNFINFLKHIGCKKYYITIINYVEGLASTKFDKIKKLKLKRFLDKMPLLNFNSKSNNFAKQLSLNYVSTASDHKDLLICSVALANNMPVITANVSEFRQYKDIKILKFDPERKY